MLVHALILARNEQENLADCISSLRNAADAITVFDTGSYDQTAAEAREIGVSCVALPWTDDFAAARNEALQHIQADWVLVLDADERLAARCALEVRRAVSEAAEETQVLYLEQRTYTDDVEALGYVGLSGAESLRRGAAGYVSTPDARLLRSGRGLHYSGRVEEQLYDGQGKRVPRNIAPIGVLHHLRELEPLERRRVRARRRLQLAFREALENNDAEALAKLGATLNQQRQWKSALTYLRAAEDQDESGGTIHMQAGLARLQLGLVDGAVASFRRAWDHLPGHPEVATWLARALLQQGNDLWIAGELLEMSLELAPELDQTVLQRAHWHRRREEYEDARAWLQTLLERNPVHPTALKELGAVALLQGKVLEAELHLRQAARMRPLDPEILNNLGCTLERRGQWQEALAAFDTAVELAGGDSRYLRNRCLAHAACGSYTLMCEDALRAIHASDQPDTVLISLGEDFLDAGWLTALERLEIWALEEGWLAPDEGLMRKEGDLELQAGEMSV